MYGRASRTNMDSVHLSPLILCCLWIFNANAGESGHTHWTYTGANGQSEWADHFPSCGGASQSPIDVLTAQTKHDPSLTPVTPLGYSHHGNMPFELSNNGHSVVVKLPDWMGLGGLPWLFTAVQMHLHWGSGGPSHGGSEHTIDGHSADAELHVVHYNSDKFSNISEAMTQTHGLAVLGILIETGEETNEAFNNIFNYLGRVRHAGQKASIPAFDIQSLLPTDLTRYYRYNGSLTTPPCHQSVLWTLFHHAVRISPAQLLRLETVLYSSKEEEEDRMLLQDNYRSTQPLNHRVIYASFAPGSFKDLSPGEVTAIVVGVMCGLVGVAVIARFIVKTIRSSSSWDVLPSNRPAPMPRTRQPEKDPKQDVALNSTSDASAAPRTDQSAGPTVSPQSEP